ncbi:hypothetical protein F3Y22_tig00014728pilonHSYRG00105 [Hibiscus syriacus]|uniref:Uncharacterized protein n=1 Tax=Hibiscus syriacus TaxID=106335 RepID=A0A6A3C4M6_HIBSY|nr:hypothetical protein F3Y22_tig00014728pilonHSYRG00105 [Hibiscus syriacus]
MLKEIEDKLAKIEREQKQMQEEMRNKLTQMEASITNSHLDLLNKVKEMFRGHLTTGKTTVEDPTHPPGFTPVHIPEHTSTRQEIRSPVCFENPQYQVRASFPINFPAASGLKPSERCTNMEVPNLNELAEMEKIVQRVKDIEEMFKALDFEKYNGTTCPSAHLTMFCRRMTGGRCKTWKSDIAKPSGNTPKDGAMWHHKYNPHCWRRRLQLSFLNIVKAPYLGHLVGNVTKNFADLVISGELIENAIRNGKIGGSDSTDVKKGADVNIVSSYSTNHGEKPYKMTLEKTPIREIPVTYEDLLPVLVEKNIVTLVRSKPKEPPFPEGHDANAVFSYHMGSSGHTTENCRALKRKVQHLIDSVT